MITLHNEIVNVLNEVGRTLTTTQIAEIINRRMNYRKKDGSVVTAFQIHGRTRNYKKLFDRNGSTVALKSQKQNNPNEITKPRERTTSENVTAETENDIAKIDYLSNTGFINIGEIGHLLENGLPLEDELNYCGCYAITIPTNYQPDYFLPEEAIKNGNVINPWEVERLEKKWVKNVDVAYYGIAGIRSQRSLRKRISDLIKHGNGKTTDRGPHKGGEIFWQLKGYENFSLWILPIKNPRLHEENYLVNFHGQTGKLPFANRQF